MKGKVAHNILLTAAFVAFWCLGVALFSNDPHGVNFQGLIGGLIGIAVFWALHTRARGGDRNAEKNGKHSVSTSCS